MKTMCEEEGYSKARSREHPFLSPQPPPSSSQSHHMQLFHASSTDVGTACSTGLQQDWVLTGMWQCWQSGPCWFFCSCMAHFPLQVHRMG